MTIRNILGSGLVVIGAGVAAWAVATIHTPAGAASLDADQSTDWYEDLPPALRALNEGDTRSSGAHPEAPSDVVLVDFDELPPIDAPRLSFALPKNARALEFGEIRFGTSKSITIQVANTGSAPLEIKGMKSSCGCLSLHSDKLGGTFEPGERREVTMTYQATSRSPGTHRKVVTVLSSDPQRPRFRLPVRATIVLPLRIAETLVKFEPTGVAREQSATLRIVGLPNEPANWSVRMIRTAIRQTKIETVELPFEVTKDEMVANARELTLTIKLGDPREPGRYISPLIIDTDHAEQPQLNVQSILNIRR